MQDCPKVAEQKFVHWCLHSSGRQLSWDGSSDPTVPEQKKELLMVCTVEPTTVESGFNKVQRDWGSWFVISKTC